MTNRDLGRRVAVQGNGWSAVLLVASLLRRDEVEHVEWIPGSAPRLSDPTPLVSAGSVPAFLGALAQSWGIEMGDPVRGSYLREFRNRAFRESSWSVGPTPEARSQIIAETLWGPERNWAHSFEARFSDKDPEHLEEALRIQLIELASSGEASDRRLVVRENVSLSRVSATDGAGTGELELGLSDGTSIAVQSLLFADRWSEIPKITGLPRPLPFLRNREAVGMLQALFRHSRPIGAGIDEAFAIPLPQDSDEDFERQVWGYFSRDGMQSTWSVALSSGEAEDNTLIGKRLRRVKTALDRTFSGHWVMPESKDGLVAQEHPQVESQVEGSEEEPTQEAGYSREFLEMLRERKRRLAVKPEAVTFTSLVHDEQVRFSEACLFLDGDPVVKPVELKALPGIWFFTDGYGSSNATLQVLEFARAHQLLDWRSNSETEEMNLSGSKDLPGEIQSSSRRDQVIHQEPTSV